MKYNNLKVLAETEGIREGGAGGMTLRAEEWKRRQSRKQGSKVGGGGGGGIVPRNDMFGAKYHLKI